MITPFDDSLEVILASKSPRRQELISQLFVNFDIIEPDVDEVVPDGVAKKDIPEYLARLKSVIDIALKPYQVLVTADTLVFLDNEILGKPKDLEDAKTMLRNLSGKTHQVISGVCIRSLNNTMSFSVTTDITFYPLTEDEIEFYVTNYEVLDKAGAYAIQDWIGLVGVERIDGDYYNVVGLPVSRLVKEMKTFYAENSK